MKKLDNNQCRELCLKLLHAETENEVVEILKKSNLWYHEENWRLLSDSPSNWSTVGNQQSKSVPSLIEKLVNSIDTVLISTCIQNGVDPRSPEAPQNMYDAIEKFFNIPNGMLGDISGGERSKLAQFIHLVATGIPKRDPCYTVIDQGEGQTPTNIHSTILSLPGRKGNPNKKGIPFVQGIFNMGGTGVIPFCGKQSIQLIITKRNPKLLPDSAYDKDKLWSFTVIRRRAPSKSRSSSVIEYLAPINVSGRELNDTLTFSADSIPALPKAYDKRAKSTAEHAYSKPMSYGTCIKLYEYQIGPRKANIQFDLNYELSRHFFKMGLPIRLDERRLVGYDRKKFSGHTFDTTLAGMSVRLEEGRNDLIKEKQFGAINIQNVGELNYTIHVLQNIEHKNRNRYHAGAEIQIIVNGQQHGTLPKSLFSRKSVGLDHIESDLFVILDATNISVQGRENLFMASRDRLRAGDEKVELEKSLIEELKDNERLHELNEEAKQKALEKAMKDTRTLQDVFSKLVKKDPVLAKFFPQLGPVVKPAGFKWKKTSGTYVGKKTPSFFRLGNDDKKFKLQCPMNKHATLIFEHNAENDYFRRPVRPAKLKIYAWNKKKKDYVQNRDLFKSINTTNGISKLKFQPLPKSKAGDEHTIKIELIDKKFSNDHPKLATIFKGKIKFYKSLSKTQIRKCQCECHNAGGTSGCNKCKENHKSKKPAKPYTRTPVQIIGEGEGGMSLPIPVPVHENDENWDRFGFTKSTGFKVTYDAKDFMVYVNMDNEFLLQELVGENEPDFVLTLYKSAMALVAFGIYHKLDKKQTESREDERPDYENMSTQERAGEVSDGIAMVLLPIITKLGGEAKSGLRSGDDENI